MAEGRQDKVKIINSNKEITRTQSPTNKYYALKLLTFGAILGVRQSELQWVGLILKMNHLCDHGVPLSQVSMLPKGVRLS